VDLKICYGVILLLYYPEGETIPMTICDIHSGEEIAKVSCKREPDGEDTLQIMEQFNEYLLVKTKNKALRIINLFDDSKVEVNDFRLPEAFIFVYEKGMFLSLANGKIQKYSIFDGSL
jgi:hypothetical protein